MIDSGNTFNTHETWRFMRGEQSKGKYLDIRMISNSVEGSLIDINSKFIACSWEPQVSTNSGVVILDFAKSKDNEAVRTPQLVPRICGHASLVTHVKFHNFNDNILATCSNDKTVRLWEIPDDGVKSDIKQEKICYKEHTKKTNLCYFHPSCADVVASASHDNTIHTWNCNTAQNVTKVNINEQPTALCWNSNGAFLGACGKAKGYIIDPRTGKITHTTTNFDSPKNCNMKFISENCFIVLCGGKNQKRSLKLFDVRKSKDGVLTETAKHELDINNLFVCSQFDDSANFFICSGKGEKSYYVFDVSGENLKLLTVYKGGDHYYFTLCDKRQVDYKELEVCRWGEVDKNSIQFHHLYLYKNDKTFDANVYPPVCVPVPTLDFNSWMGGKNAELKRKFVNEF